MKDNPGNSEHHLKEKILNQILKMVDEKIEVAKHGIHLAKESRDNETKSSAGDKYETGRSMMQFEMEKHQVRLQKLQTQKFELSKINPSKTTNYIEFGSLVYTNNGNYFVSTGIGKIEVANKSIICISPNSPIGKIIMNKMKGDKFDFQGKEFSVIEWY